MPKWIRGIQRVSTHVRQHMVASSQPAFPSVADTPAALTELKILVIDDHYLVREGLKLAIKQLDHHACILETETLMEGVDAYHQNPDVDLVLLDLNLPGASGIESLETLYATCPDAKVVVISATHDMKTVQAALRRGVCGFIPKLAGSTSLLNALRFVLNGDIYVPPEVFLSGDAEAEARTAPERTSNSRITAETPQAAGLTARQIEVLGFLLEGKSNKQICRDLNLALGTVKSHVAAILQALGAGTRSQAVAAVDGLGWRPLVQPESRPPGSTG